MNLPERRTYPPLSAQQLTGLLREALEDPGPQKVGKFIAELVRSAACLTEEEFKKLKLIVGIKEE